MKTVHLYLQPGDAGAIDVVCHTFAGGTPSVARISVSADAREDWLAALAADPDLKAVYNCHGTGAVRPPGLRCVWFDLPAGHPCEHL